MREGVSRKLPAAMYGLVLIMLEVDPSSTRQCKVASSARLARRTPGHCSRTDSSVKQTTGVEVGGLFGFDTASTAPQNRVETWNRRACIDLAHPHYTLLPARVRRPSQPAADEIDDTALDCRSSSRIGSFDSQSLDSQVNDRNTGLLARLIFVICCTSNRNRTEWTFFFL